MPRLLALALIFLPVLLAPWTPADSGQRICANRTLTEQDQRRLFKITNAAVPEGESWQAPSSICRNRGSASAWLETPQRLVAEGAHEWWSMHCRRAIPSLCERSTESDDSAWAKARDRYRLDPTTAEVQASVSTEENVTEVMLFEGAGLGFTFRRGDLNDRSIVSECWSEWVIVT